MNNQERWIWTAIYSDDTKLCQFDESGQHKFAEIDVKRMVVFRMNKSDDEQKFIDMKIEPDRQQVFHFYRNITLESLTPNEKKFRLYIFGWKDRQMKSCVYNYILPNDSLVISDKDIPINLCPTPTLTQ